METHEKVVATLEQWRAESLLPNPKRLLLSLTECKTIHYARAPWFSQRV